MLRSKRWWIVTMQLLIGAALAGVAFTIPAAWWLQGSLAFFWLMAFSSATHDIAADGFYMLGLDQHEQAYFVGIRSTFYRIATIFSSGLLVGLAGALQVLTRNIRYSWSLVFYLMAGLFIALWLYHSWALPKPSEDGERMQRSVSGILNEFRQTLVTFFQKPQVWAGICFMLFYRMPEGLLAKISALFLVDAGRNGGLGLSDGEYGLVQGTVGVIGLTLGGILGGFAASRDGLKRWLWPMVMAITLPDLVYVYMSYALPDSLWLVSTMLFIEQFGYGLGFTALTLYMLFFAQGAYKTSHYAICTGISYLGLMLPGMVSGWLKDAVGYRQFFIIVMAFCLVTFVVTALIHIDPNFGKKQES
jgi:PAT family beta-lactamase induction signal transducer AmpG